MLEIIRKLQHSISSYQATDTDILRAKKANESGYILRIVSGYLAIPLFISFWITDWFYAPEYKWDFLVLRILVVPLSYSIHNLLTKPWWSFDNIQKIVVFYIFGLGMTINSMIFIMGDPTTPYYGGLLILAVAGLIFFPLERRYFVAAATAIFGPYYVALLTMDGVAEVANDVALNSSFIVGMIFVSWVGRFFAERLRTQESDRQKEIQEKMAYSLEMEREVMVSRSDATAAAAASESKSRFLAHVSHELRTPLTSIMGYSEVALKSCTTNNCGDTLASIEKVNVSSQYLALLVDGLLDFAAIEAGRISIQKECFDIEKLCHEVKSTIDYLLQPKDIDFNMVICPTVRAIKADRVKLKQILINLIANAIKFTDKGKVELLIDCAEDDTKDKILEISVVDTGVGIPKDKLSIVFEGFSQLSSGQKKKHKGTGLGLSIVKHYCEFLGGQIAVESVEGQGSKFSFSLPYEIADEKIANTTIENRNNVQNSESFNDLKVLLADDDQIILGLFKKLIESEGHTVDAVSDGQQALDRLNTQHYDAAILDVHMPELTGFEVIEALSADLRKILPVIVLTADATNDVKVTALNNHVAIVKKPIQSEELLKLFYQQIKDKKDLQHSDASSELKRVLPARPTKRLTIQIKRVLDDQLIENLLSLDATGNFQRETLKTYIDQTSQLINEFHQAVKRSDTKRIRGILHTLEGGSATLGMSGVTEAVQYIRKCLSSDYHEVHVLSEVLDSTFKQTVAVIEKNYFTKQQRV